MQSWNEFLVAQGLFANQGLTNPGGVHCSAWALPSHQRGSDFSPQLSPRGCIWVLRGASLAKRGTLGKSEYLTLEMKVRPSCAGIYRQGLSQRWKASMEPRCGNAVLSY